MKTAKKPLPIDVTFEGNNGGSYLRLEETDAPGVVRLTVGHDCVYACRDVEIGVFALCAILTQAWDSPGFRAMFSAHYNGSPPDWGGPVPDKADQKPRR